LVAFKSATKKEEAAKKEKQEECFTKGLRHNVGCNGFRHKKKSSPKTNAFGHYPFKETVQQYPGNREE
jgi:hypothetical protein